MVLSQLFGIFGAATMCLQGRLDHDDPLFNDT